MSLSDAGDADAHVLAFLKASVTGRLDVAVRLLEPWVARFDIRTAAVLGDVDRVGELLASAEPDADLRWPPLLYACHSHWHHIEPERAAGLLAVARLLLDAGASPDTGNGHRIRGGGYRSALYGAAGIANNPAITELLLERGAHPNDGESLYHSVRFRDHACLRLLLAHGAQVAWSNALAAAAGDGDVEAVQLLVAAGGDPGRSPSAQLADRSTNPLVAAADSATAAVLLDAGADPNAHTDEDLSVLRQAVRRGDTDLAALLTRHGAVDDTAPLDHFIGACVRADRAEAVRLLPAELSDVDRSALVTAAGQASTAAVGLMLELGFLVADRDDDGSTALHEAAYAGRTDVARMLLDHGAEVDVRDTRWDSTPLCMAAVGSGECTDLDGDWVGTVRLLLAAGASPAGVWIEDKPPSDDVAAVLAEHGGEPPSHHVPDPAVMSSVADRLRDAMDRADLGSFGELLDPHVRWGTCTNADQVLRWYEGLRAGGARADVVDLRVQDDTIVVESLVHEGGESGRVTQVFQVAGGAIVSIRPLFEV